MSQLGRSLGALCALAATSATLAACGGTDGGGAATTSSEADRDTARLRFERCMRDNGVDLPAPGPGRAAAARTLRLDRDKVQTAMRACDKYRQAAFGNLTDEQRQEFRDAAAKFEACMRKQGVELPRPRVDQGGRGGAGGFVQRRADTNLSPREQAAMKACQSELPQRPGGRGGGPVIRFGPGPGADSGR